MEIQNAIISITTFGSAIANGLKTSINQITQNADGQHLRVLIAYLMVGVSLSLVVLVINHFIKRRSI